MVLQKEGDCSVQEDFCWKGQFCDFFLQIQILFWPKKLGPISFLPQEAENTYLYK